MAYIPDDWFDPIVGSRVDCCSRYPKKRVVVRELMDLLMEQFSIFPESWDLRVVKFGSDVGQAEDSWRVVWATTHSANCLQGLIRGIDVSYCGLVW